MLQNDLNKAEKRLNGLAKAICKIAKNHPAYSRKLEDIAFQLHKAQNRIGVMAVEVADFQNRHGG